jgi:hypothetical protein
MFVPGRGLDGNHVVAAKVLGDALRRIGAVPTLVLPNNGPVNWMIAKHGRDMTDRLAFVRTQPGIALVSAISSAACDMRWAKSPVYVRSTADGLRVYSGPVLSHGLSKSPESSTEVLVSRSRPHQQLETLARHFSQFRYRVDPTSIPTLRTRLWEVDVYLEPLPAVTVSPGMLDFLNSLPDHARPAVVGRDVKTLPRREFDATALTDAFSTQHDSETRAVYQGVEKDPSNFPYGVAEYIDSFVADLVDSGWGSDVLTSRVNTALGREALATQESGYSFGV